jgi:transposase InsO family protein
MEFDILRPRRSWNTRPAARCAIFEHLEIFYNGQRRHPTPGFLSPRAFEQQRATQNTGNLTQASTRPEQAHD